jgi:hypothetical protein
VGVEVEVEVEARLTAAMAGWRYCRHRRRILELLPALPRSKRRARLSGATCRPGVATGWRVCQPRIAICQKSPAYPPSVNMVIYYDQSQHESTGRSVGRRDIER